MIRVTRDTVDPLFCVLRFGPGLEETGGSLLMAGDTESNIDLIVLIFLNRRARGEGQSEDNKTHESKTNFHLSSSNMSHRVATE
jgi:hypothetical protein